ncbi:MAG: hypothetical protein IAE79_12950 [Anaerolinea sp.]|nr:hypothetical protein [Anaerolinea sp.]
MPKDVQRSANKIQGAYQFAVANPEIADAIPCYCGCVGLGHIPPATIATWLG